MKKRVPYCICRSCVCADCKKPFATWIKDKSESFETIQIFSGKCTECYNKNDE